MSVEILSEKFEPLPGYGREECKQISSSFNASVSWTAKELIESIGGSIRIRIDFTGLRFEDVSLFAAYLRAA